VRRIWPCTPYLLGIGGFVLLIVGLYGAAFGVGVAAFASAIVVDQQRRDAAPAKSARRWL
jgi:hypothetical protein